jgi:hypothetical protein
MTDGGGTGGKYGVWQHPSNKHSEHRTLISYYVSGVRWSKHRRHNESSEPTKLSTNIITPTLVTLHYHSHPTPPPLGTPYFILP